MSRHVARSLAVVALALPVLASGCGRDEPDARELRVFHASGLTPVLEAVRADALAGPGIKLLAEGSGSQVACRKLSELGRDCDLVMVADSALIAELLDGTCSWRLDFARDEVVLAVGVRAPYVSEAEQHWVPVLLRPDVRLGRVDENQGPIGYRALLVWRLQELRGSPGLSERLRAKCDKVVDHVTRLTPLLKSGDVDYAFVYRSICIARDIRYIELDEAVNLGADGVDYSSAEVQFEKLSAGERETVTVRGAPITWSLSIPDRGADAKAAAEFVRYLIVDKREVLDRNGLRPLEPPLFYGPRDAFAPLASFARRAGDMK